MQGVSDEGITRAKMGGGSARRRRVLKLDVEGRPLQWGEGFFCWKSSLAFVLSVQGITG